MKTNFPNLSFVGWMMPAKSMHARCCTTMFVMWLSVIGLPAADSQGEEFFCFGMSDTKQNRDGKIEVDSFLSDPSRSLDSFRKFPTILKIFLRCNKSLLSIAHQSKYFSVLEAKFINHDLISWVIGLLNGSCCCALTILNGLFNA